MIPDVLELTWRFRSRSPAMLPTRFAVLYMVEPVAVRATISVRDAWLDNRTYLTDALDRDRAHNDGRYRR